jgi:hypothetical protein
MRIHAEKQRTINLVQLSIQRNRLADSEDVPLVEGLVERRTPMSCGAESDPLGGNGRVRLFSIVGRDQPGHIHQHRCWRRLSRKWTYLHDAFAKCCRGRFSLR